MVRFVVKQIFASRNRARPQRFVAFATSMLSTMPGVEVVAAADEGIEVHGIDEAAIRQAAERCYQRFPTEFETGPVGVVASALGAQPIMTAEFTVPWRCNRELRRRLGQRGIEVDNYETVEGVIHLYASGPMENLLGIDLEVAEVSAGEGSAALRFSHYEPVAVRTGGSAVG